MYATHLSRESIFTGLEMGRIFSNSDHGRPILDFTINGTRVGDNSPLEVGSGLVAREINVFLAQDGAPAGTKSTAASVTIGWSPDWTATVEIIKNGEILTQISVTEPVTSITYLDTTPITGTSYGEESCIEVNGQHYINNYSDNPVNPASLNTNGADFYIVRVVGDNGRITYAGPIWVESST